MTSSVDSTDRARDARTSVQPDQAARIGRIVHQLHQVAHQSEAIELLADAARELGASAAFFASLMAEREGSTTCRVLLACEPIGILAHHHAVCLLEDPWLVYATTRTEPLRGQDISGAPRANGSTSLALRDHPQFHTAVVVPAPSTGGLTRAGALCLGYVQPEPLDEEGFTTLTVVARGVAMEFHEWWLRRLREELIEDAGLSPEDIFLLAQERQGHTTKVIARLRGWTTGAVDSRFQRLNTKLGVLSRKAAARLAAEYGLV